MLDRKMENTQLQGPVPVSLFSLPNLETVWVSPESQLLKFLIWRRNIVHCEWNKLYVSLYFHGLCKDSSYILWYDTIIVHKVIDLTCCDRVLRDNQLNGTLNMGTNYSSHLQLVDLQNNIISEPPRVIGDNISLMWATFLKIFGYFLAIMELRNSLDELSL